MNRFLRVFCVFWLCLVPPLAGADSKVFPVNNARPEEVLQTLRSLYGDKARVDIIQQRLVVVGSSATIAEISQLLAQLDRPPQALRLTLREQPPADSTANAVTYSSSDNGGLTIDTVAGALVNLERAQLAQQPTSNGWMIAIDNVPTEFSSIMLQVQLQGQRNAQVLVSYAKEQNQRRRVFGNTISGELGTWLPLLPRTGDPEDQESAGSVTYSTGPKPGSQLYLRIDPLNRAKGPH